MAAPQASTHLKKVEPSSRSSNLKMMISATRAPDHITNFKDFFLTLCPSYIEISFVKNRVASVAQLVRVCNASNTELLGSISKFKKCVTTMTPLAYDVAGQP